MECLSDGIILTSSYLYWNNQVVRGKQVHYCYDDADLKKLQRSFPPNASYNMQRFKGMIKSYFGWTLLALELFVGLYFNFDKIIFSCDISLFNCKGWYCLRTAIHHEVGQVNFITKGKIYLANMDGQKKFENNWKCNLKLPLSHLKFVKLDKYL